MPTNVILVTRDDGAELVRYLTDVGFEVELRDSVSRAHREGTLLWLLEPDADDRATTDTIRTWLGASTTSRVVVVTDRPARLRATVLDARGRVLVLPAPAFAWQIVDALHDRVLT